MISRYRPLSQGVALGKAVGTEQSAGAHDPNRGLSHRRTMPSPKGKLEMKTRAAVAFAPKTPLEIVEVDLEGPKAGEVLVEIMATGICHTDAYTLDGLDPRASSLDSRP
jgi:hypothetical protein